MTNALADGTSMQAGRHIMSREGPITRVTVHGIISLEDVHLLLAQYQAMIDEQGFALILMDVRDSGDMAMPARRLATDWGGRNGHCVRSAVFGASYFVRTVLELLNRAAGLIGGKAPTIVFSATYEEARDWLLAQVPSLPKKIAI